MHLNWRRETRPKTCNGLKKLLEPQGTFWLATKASVSHLVDQCLDRRWSIGGKKKILE